MSAVTIPRFNFRAVMSAAREVEERLDRITTALNASGVPYAVIGGNAVAHWVSTKNPHVIRMTKDVDVLMRQEDLKTAGDAIRSSGFIYRHAAGIDFFLDGPGSRFSDAVHIVKAGLKVRPEYVLPAPDVSESVVGEEGYPVVTLEALVRMKLTSFRKSDQTHVEDLIGVGLVDRTWLDLVPIELRDRLQKIFEELPPPRPEILLDEHPPRE